MTDYRTIHVEIVEKTEANVKAFILFSKEDLATITKNEAITKRVTEIFAKDTTEVILNWGEELQILVLVPNRNFEKNRKAGAQLFSELLRQEIREVLLYPSNNATEKENYAFVEGMMLSGYDFSKYKSIKNNGQIKISLSKAVLSVAQLKELHQLIDSVSLTKTLVNEPVNFLNSLVFSKKIEEAGRKYGFETEVLHKPQIESLKMGGLLGVNKGSETPPTFNILRYEPKNAINKQPLVLVGKGVTYDTGGYSIKTGGNMLTMKCDMGGGAAVVGALSAIASNKLPYCVIGLIPATDNKISANALVPDDIITMMDGTTVEVQNTDAEGRLILADALTYAKQFSPELVIDMATLTGASAVITGNYGIAALSNNQAEFEKLKNIGEEVYERLVQLPLWEEYSEQLKSEIADLRNIGGRIGGVSTAAKFLEHFTDYPWIHLDIAGAAFLDSKKDYRQAGGTAVPVRLLYEFVKRLTSSI